MIPPLGPNWKDYKGVIIFQFVSSYQGCCCCYWNCQFLKRLFTAIHPFFSGLMLIWVGTKHFEVVLAFHFLVNFIFCTLWFFLVLSFSQSSSPLVFHLSYNIFFSSFPFFPLSSPFFLLLLLPFSYYSSMFFFFIYFCILSFLFSFPFLVSYFSNFF